MDLAQFREKLVTAGVLDYQDSANPINWILFPGGKKAIFRRPSETVFPGCRKATAEELFFINQTEFPWGKSPDPARANHLWKQYRESLGGLICEGWFKTDKNERLGGGLQVPLSFPATLRYSLFVGGGECAEEALEANEGFAVVKEMDCGLCAENVVMRDKVQVYASTAVAADGGRIFVSPVGADKQVYVGFGGRCMETCKNLEDLSFPALKKAVQGWNFRLFPEFRNWHEGQAAHLHSLG